MSRKLIFIALIGATLALGGWALAQQQPPVAKIPPQPDIGHFAISPAGQSAVLLDTKTGKTWVLTRSVDGESVWLPAKRIDSDIEAHDYREYQKKMRTRLVDLENVKKN